MATATELMDEVKCLGCHSNASQSELLKLGLLQRIALLAPAYSFIQRTGITDATQIAAINQLVLSAQDHGWWTKCDLIYPFVGGTAGTHAQNLKSSSFTITWNGTVTHNANGITGNGTTGYGDTGYIPSSGQVTLNSVHAGVYRRITGTSANRFYFGVESGLTRISISRAIAAGNVNAAVHDGAATTMGAASLAWMIANRSDSATKHLFTGVVDLSSAAASVSVPVIVSYILASNFNGVAVGFSNSNLAFATAGSGFTFAEYQVMAADIQTFQTALGRQV